MLKTVLWIAAACAAILVALAVSRTMNFDEPAKAPEKAAVVETAPEPVAPPAPPPVTPEIKEAPPPLTAEEQQIQDDAAATGMTTMEPEPPAEPPTN